MKLGEKVHCKSYLQKFSDGVFLNPCESDGTPRKGSAWSDMCECKAYKDEYSHGTWKTKEIADLSGFEGESVPKQYRRRVEEEFDGVFVGFTHIVVSGRIGTDMTMHPYNMNGDLEEVFHLTKETDKQKVAVVYFKNNARRYVPVDDIERRER